MHRVIGIGAALSALLIAGCSSDRTIQPAEPSLAAGSSTPSVTEGPVATTSPTVVPSGPEQPGQAVDPATRDQITSLTIRAIEDYNDGNLADLLAISCGQLLSELERTNMETFAAESRSAIETRGRGAVTKVTDITVLRSFASAGVIVRYERSVQGLDPANEALFSGVYQRSGETWQICGLS
ncbi:hypothetical protein [Nocardia xishanensis]